MTTLSSSRPQRLICIGECMVELAPGEAEDQFALSFAGDTFNTAWYAKRLAPDWDVAYLSAVGEDAISARMLGFMQAAGIDTDLMEKRADRSVGLYMIELQEGERSFSYWRSHSAARMLAEDAAHLARAFAEPALLYASGITMGVLSPQARARLCTALDQARTQGSTVAFDPNLRPRLWPDTDTMCTAIMEAARVSDIALPSYDDEATFFGDADPEATLARYLDAGCSTVVVKNGAGPILFSHDGQIGRFEPPPAKLVIDTTAAGDSFNAGFFTAFMAGQAMQAALDAGASLARKVIAGRGALIET